MEPTLTNNNNNTDEAQAPFILDNPSRKPRVPNVRSLSKDPKYEGLRVGIVEATLMAGVLCDYITIAAEDPTNAWVRRFLVVDLS